MVGAQRRLGRIGPAPVVADPRVLVTAGLVPVLVFGYLRDRTGAPPGQVLTAALAVAVLLAASVLLHELAHAAAALRVGVRVERIVLGPFGAGVQLDERRLTAGRTALIAVVGPLASLLLAAAGLAVLRAVPAGSGSLVWWGAAVVGGVNGALGVLNLLPALPMDGGRLLSAAVWRVTGDRARGALVAAWAGRVLAVVVLAVLVVRPWLAGVRPDLLRVVAAVVTAGFLWVAAGASLRAARAQQRVAALRLVELVSPAVALPGTDTVADADALGGLPVVVLGPDGGPVGYVDADGAAAVPADLRSRTPLSGLARSLPAGATVQAGLRGADAVRAVAEAAPVSPVLAVLDDDVVVGLLRAADVVQAIRSGAGTRDRPAGRDAGRT